MRPASAPLDGHPRRRGSTNNAACHFAPRNNSGVIMELAWLEDFLVLSDTLNFSRAATMRNLSQPSFSRRIQNLEHWMGTTLIDRSTFPATLTEIGRSFRKAAEEIVQSLNSERDQARGQARPKRSFLSFSMIQTIATSFFPDWLVSIEAELGPLRARVIGANVHDCVQALTNANCDIMLCYNYPTAPVLLDGAQFPSLLVADEYLVPVCTTNKHGKPAYDLDAKHARPIPYLGFARHAYLSRLVEMILEEQPNSVSLDLCFESALAASLKAMVLDGRGVAWLPSYSVRQELSSGSLAIAGSKRWTAALEVRAYRNALAINRQVERLWDHLNHAVQARELTPHTTNASERTALVKAKRPVHPSETRMPSRKLKRIRK